MRRSIKVLVLAIVVAALMAFLASPALAINDIFVPADQCSGNPTVVGEPAIFGLNQPNNPVSKGVSANNPGVSTGAKGQLQSQAIGTCA